MHATARKYDTLTKELKELQDRSMNQQHDLERKLRVLQEENRSLQEDVDERQEDLSSLDRQHKRKLQDIDSKHAALQKTLSDLQGDLESKSASLQTTQESLSQKLAEVGRLESEVLRLKAQAGDADTLDVIKRELSEQVSHIRRLERTNREQAAELKQFRQNHKAVEIVEEEKRTLENKIRLMDDLRRELGEAQIQRQILEDEKNSWASYLRNIGETGAAIMYDSPVALAKAMVQERLEKASLVEQLGAVRPEVLERDEIIKSLELEKAKLHSELEHLKARGGSGDSRARSRLERQRALAVKEVEYLREQLRTFDSEETTFQPESQVDLQKAKCIQDLESLVDRYRAELKALNDDLSSRDDHASATLDTQSLKRAREDDSDERLGSLTRKNRKLQDSLSSLEKSTALLNKDLEATRSQLKSLQSSSRTRILELRSNPTADAESLKLSTLTTLREENRALLAQVEGQPIPTKVVPVSTLEAIRAEMRDLETVVAEKEKRMLRLKQIWTLKAGEFREAIISILGWKMDVMPNGRFRMTSIFNPGLEEDEDDGGGGGNSLIFDGETGIFKVSGGMESEFAKEIRPLIRFWVEERKEIPAFLAALTLEFYEQTTRAARM